MLGCLNQISHVRISQLFCSQWLIGNPPGVSASTHCISLTSPALLHEESLLWFHILNPSQKSLCQRSPTSPVHLSYKLDLPSLDQLLGCMPGYPSQAGMLVDRIHGSQKLFSKHIGTLSPRNVLGGKRRRVVMQGTYDQITFCLFRNKLFGRSYCALSIH